MTKRPITAKINLEVALSRAPWKRQMQNDINEIRREMEKIIRPGHTNALSLRDQNTRLGTAALAKAGRHERELRSGVLAQQSPLPFVSGNLNNLRPIIQGVRRAHVDQTVSQAFNALGIEAVTRSVAPSVAPAAQPKTLLDTLAAGGAPPPGTPIPIISGGASPPGKPSGGSPAPAGGGKPAKSATPSNLLIDAPDQGPEVATKDSWSRTAKLVQHDMDLRAKETADFGKQMKTRLDAELDALTQSGKRTAKAIDHNIDIREKETSEAGKQIQNRLKDEQKGVEAMAKARESSEKHAAKVAEEQRLRDTNAALKTYHNTAKKAFGDVTTHATAASKAVNNMAISQRILNQAGAVFMGLSLHRGFQSIFQAIGASKNEFLSFERQMAQIRAISDDLSGDALPKFREEIKKVAKELGRDPLDIAKATYESIQTNISDPRAALNIATLAGKGAALGDTDSQTVSRGLISVMNAYYGKQILNAKATGDWTEVNKTAIDTMDKLYVLVKDGAVKWSELSDALGNTITSAANLGYSLDEVLAAVATLTKQGLSPSKATTAINNLLTHLIQSSTAAEKAALGMGVAMTAESVAAHGLFGMLTQVANAINAADPNMRQAIDSGASYAEIMDRLAQKTAISNDRLVQMFPDLRTLRAVVGLTGEGMRMWGEDIVSVTHAAGALEGAWGTWLNDIPSRSDRVTQGFKSLGDEVWQRLYPAMLAVGEAALKVGASFAVGFIAAAALPAKAVGVLSDAVNVLLGLMGDEWERTFNSASRVAGILAGSLTTLTAAVVALKVVSDASAGVGLIGGKLAAGKTFVKDAYGQAAFGAAILGQRAKDGITAIPGAFGRADRRAKVFVADAAVAGLGMYRGGKRNLGNKISGRRTSDIVMGGAAMTDQTLGFLGRRQKTNQLMGAVGAGDDYVRTDLMNKRPGAMKRGAGAIGNAVGSAAMFVPDIAIKSYDKLSDSITKAGGKKQWFAGLAKGAGGGLKSLAGTILSAAASFGIWGIAAAAAAGAIIALGIAVAQNSEGIKSAFDSAWEGIKAGLIWIGEVIFTVINKILEYVSHWVNAFLLIGKIINDDGLTWGEKFQEIAKVIVTAMAECAKTLLGVFRDIFDGVSFIIINARTTLLRNLGSIIDMFTDFVLAVHERLAGFNFNNMLQKVRELGKDLWNAIVFAKDWVMKKVKAIGGWAIGVGNKFLEIFGVDKAAKGITEAVSDIGAALKGELPTLKRIAEKHGIDFSKVFTGKRTDSNVAERFKSILQDVYGINAQHHFNEAWRDGVFSDIEKNALEMKALARNALGGLDSYKFTSWKEFQDSGKGLGTAMFQPMIDWIDNAQKTFGLSFKQLGEKYNFDPVKLSLGTFGDFVAAIQKNLADAKKNKNDTQQMTDATQGLLDMVAELNSTVDGKKMDQNVTISPHIAISVAGDVDEETVRSKVLPVIQRALADEARRIGIAAWSGG